MKAHSMSEVQGATPPRWLGRRRWPLLKDVVGGWRQNVDKLVQFFGLILGYLRPSLVRRRLERLHALGHIDVVPTIAQLLVAGRDQMILNASEETKVFYRDQGVPWIFHNLRRFISGPATMADPIGLFSPRDAIVHHVLQTFHRHPIYDLVLLRAHERGVEEMARQADEIAAGTHPRQRALTSLIEDGSYHERLPREIAAFQLDPNVPARPIPDGLLPDPELMLGMEQFKDIRGFARYASRLKVGFGAAVGAWVMVGFDETVGHVLGMKLGPRHIRVEACEPEFVARHVPGALATISRSWPPPQSSPESSGSAPG
jgi:hypothetical protein